MIAPSFIKRHTAYGHFKPISDSLMMTHGVSYQDEQNVRMSGPSFQSKQANKLRMSKEELSVK